jgi:hypothetical protein
MVGEVHLPSELSFDESRPERLEADPAACCPVSSLTYFATPLTQYPSKHPIHTTLCQSIQTSTSLSPRRKL